MRVYYLGVRTASQPSPPPPSPPSNKLPACVCVFQIIRNDVTPSIEMVAEKDLSDYGRFHRSSIGEFMTLFSKTFAERTRPGVRQAVEEQGACVRGVACAAVIIGFPCWLLVAGGTPRGTDILADCRQITCSTYMPGPRASPLS